jgi:hypothetical protein
MLYISVRVSDQTYCSEYETPVLDEINDVLSANGKDVEVLLKDKRIIVRTPKGRQAQGSLGGSETVLVGKNQNSKRA